MAGSGTPASRGHCRAESDAESGPASESTALCFSRLLQASLAWIEFTGHLVDWDRGSGAFPLWLGKPSFRLWCGDNEGLFLNSHLWSLQSPRMCHFKKIIMYLFIYLFLAALGLRCCTWAFSSCGEQWLLFFFFKCISIYLFLLCWVFVSVLGLSLVVASGGHSWSRCAGLSLSRPLLLRSTGSRRAGSGIVAHGCSCSVACGIFPDQGSNPCPLHWQADSQPLRHQGSPQNGYY